jgi:hypothetical protein
MTRITGVLYEDKYTCTFMIYLAEFFLERKVFLTKVVEKIKTHILCPIFFFPKIMLFWDNTEIYVGAEQVTDNNAIRPMRIAYWVTKARYRHTLRICNIYGFSIATMIARKPFNVTLKYKYIAPLVSYLLLRDLCQDRRNIRSCLIKMSQSLYSVK